MDGVIQQTKAAIEEIDSRIRILSAYDKLITVFLSRNYGVMRAKGLEQKKIEISIEMEDLKRKRENAEMFLEMKRAERFKSCTSLRLV